MKLTTSFFVTTFIGYITAVNLRLWENPDGCDGKTARCMNVAPHTCCLARGRLWGSGSADGGGAGDEAQIWSKQGEKYCAVPLGPEKPIPVCLVSTIGSSVGGIVWERPGRNSSMAKNLQCEASVEADDYAYSDGGKTYVISMAKMKQEKLAFPTNKAETLDFFKMHADSVEDEDKIDLPVVKVNVGDVSEQKK